MPRSRASCVVVGALAAALLATSTARADEEAKGVSLLVGAHAGFAYHGGRSAVVDAVSGASKNEDVDVFTQAAFVGGISGDVGVALGPGNLGARLFVDASGPGPFFEVAVVPRYRLPFVLGTSGLRSVEPWLGVGLALDFKDAIRDPYIGFPIAAGCDFRISDRAFLTTEADLNFINPWGPTRRVSTVDGPRDYESHYDRLALKLGVAYRLF